MCGCVLRTYRGCELDSDVLCKLAASSDSSTMRKIGGSSMQRECTLAQEADETHQTYYDSSV